MGATETYVAIGVLLSLLGVVIVMVLARCCRCIKELGRNDVDDDTQDGGTIENLFQRNVLLFSINLKKRHDSPSFAVKVQRFCVIC